MMKINKKERNRAFILFMVFSIWVLFIVYKLVKIQVFDYTKYISKVKSQCNRIFSLHPKRGTIYDCNGDVLAISIRAESAFLSNKDNKESMEIFSLLSKQVRLTYREKKNIKERINKGRKFIWIKRKLEDREYEKLKKIKNSLNSTSTLGFVDEYKRVYPQKTLAAHVLGGVGIDEQGLCGIEYEIDSLIRGKGGKVKVLIDARGKIFEIEYLKKPVAGKDIFLTIDSSIQFFVEEELRRTVEKFRAKKGSVIIIDSKHGSILAMASYPFYDPVRIKHTSQRVLKNVAVSFLYDPGSTFKIILASSALENEVCHPKQIFNCYNGTFHIKNRTIHDIHPYERLTFEEIIINSSNIGAARIGLRLGKENYYRTLKRFGFGSKTGINLPAEEYGILNSLKRWSNVSVVFLSFGYEIAVTPIQMTRAFNVIASGGYLIKPNILKSVDGIVLPQVKKTKIISSSTGHIMTSIMTEVVNIGTGKQTKIEGIDIAGKTGTAKKIKNGSYENSYVSSFGGFFPANNSRITMFIVIDEPKGKFYGGEVAAPLFKTITNRLLIYLNIFPELDKGNEVRI